MTQQDDLQFDPDSLWATDKKEAISFLHEVLRNEASGTLDDVIEKRWETAALSQEAQLEEMYDEMGPEGDALRREMRAVMKREMEPNLWERFLDWWEDFWDRRKYGPKPEGDRRLGFGFAGGTSLAETHPTYVISAEYEEIFGETERFRTELGDIITKARGQSPLRFDLPDDAFAFVEESDEWTDEQETLMELSTVKAYWPADETRPALGLTEDQFDGGQPIEISLVIQDLQGHKAILEMVQRVGGRLQ